MSKFAEILKDLRIDKGLSQSELARKTGLNQSTITLWEASKSLPNLDSMIIIADYFGVSLDYLAGREN